ncbi:MAG: ABC transporter permease [Streptosporangiaceae bacterium]
MFGVPIGLAAGYKGGFTDSLISRVLDVVFSFPGLLLAIIIIATFGSGLVTAVGAISLGFVAVMARMVRNVTLSERERTYVEACKVEGFSGLRIAFGHILPNIVPVIAAQATVYFGYALLDLAGLAFLGLGVQPPASDWGQMLTTGRNDLALGAWWEVVSAAGAIGLTVIAVNLVGEFLGRKAGTQR